MSALDVDIAAELLKRDVEAAGGKVTLARRDDTIFVTVEHPASRFRESHGISRFGVTPVEVCAFSAPAPFMSAYKAAIAKAKKARKAS